MFLAMSLEVYITLVCVGLFIAALLGVGIWKFIVVCKKQHKRNKKSKTSVEQNDAVLIFGGYENILETSRQLNRILVKVQNKALVQFDVLKAMNVGTQITGNIIKCSSEKLAIALENVKKLGM
jgi:preprotein translocase subunit YajC